MFTQLIVTHGVNLCFYDWVHVAKIFHSLSPLLPSNEYVSIIVGMLDWLDGTARIKEYSLQFLSACQNLSSGYVSQYCTKLFNTSSFLLAFDMLSLPGLRRSYDLRCHSSGQR